MTHETTYMFETEKQLDAVKKSRVAYNSDRKIRSLVTLPEVKESIRDQIKQGNVVQIEKHDDSFFARYYNEEGKPIKPKLTLGKQILDEGLDMMAEKLERSDYAKMVAYPALTASVFAGVEAAAGYLTGNGGTLGNAINGSEQGLFFGLGGDALEAIRKSGIFNLAKKAKKSVEDRNFVENCLNLYSSSFNDHTDT